jgi:hypothetical protein
VVSFRPQIHCPPGRALDTHWIRGWLGPRIDLDDVERRKTLPRLGLERRLLGRPARSTVAIPTTLHAENRMPLNYAFFFTYYLLLFNCVNSAELTFGRCLEEGQLCVCVCVCERGARILTIKIIGKTNVVFGLFTSYMKLDLSLTVFTLSLEFKQVSKEGVQ